jgi:HAD superfamily hydrolase (TIGR01549 family)
VTEQARPMPLDPLPQAILFDLDDTLCDYAMARMARLRMAFSLDVPGKRCQRSEEELEAMVAASIRMHPHGVEHFAELLAQFGTDDPRVAEEAACWYRANRFHGLRLFDDTLRVLRAVREVKGAATDKSWRPIGIITNGPTEVQREKLELLGLRPIVDFVVISEEFGAAKPDASIFDEALRLAGIDAPDAVFVGDSAEFDIAGAIARNIPTIWVNRAMAPWVQEVGPPDREICSIAEVPALVGSA